MSTLDGFIPIVVLIHIELQFGSGYKRIEGWSTKLSRPATGAGMVTPIEMTSGHLECVHRNANFEPLQITTTCFLAVLHILSFFPFKPLKKM